jgi:hypothetical protein
MKIATWNVNSVRTRAALVADFLTREQPDLLLMQEIKCEAHQFPGDVFEAAPDPKPDFIVTSQFTHHLDDRQLVQFLRWLDRTAQRGWYITDLHRHAVPYYGFRVLARLMGWHRIVASDGTVSIARGFRRADWQAALAAAGVQADIRWQFPFRYGVSSLP